MKTLVTGGAGFIGSHLVKKLVEGKRKVIIVDDLSSGSVENLLTLGIKRSDFELRKIDLTDYHETLKALKDGENIFHLAARIGGIKYLHETEDAELLAMQTNLAIDANVFKACNINKIKKIVYSSSVAVYSLEKQFSLGVVFSEKDFSARPKTQDSSLKFQMSVNPDGGYGWAKLIGEIHLNWMRNVAKIGIARIFNIYGQNEPIGEKAHAISDLIKKALFYPKEDFIVWGNGNQTRDYLYVSDCVDALIKLEEKINNLQGSPLILNIGSGRAASIREITEKIIEISGKNIKPIYDSSKPVGPVSRTANINKAKDLLGWQPKINREEGLKITYSWIKEKLTK